MALANIRTLFELDEALETVLTGIRWDAGTYDSEATNFVLLNKLEELHHLGVRLEYRDSEVDDDLSSDHPSYGAWVHDEVIVMLHYQFTRNEGQQESRRSAMRLEREIILAITGALSLQSNHPRYRRTVRTIPSPGWLRSEIEFEIHRNAEVA